MTMDPIEGYEAEVVALQGLLREAYNHLEEYAKRQEQWANPHVELDFLLARIDVAIS